MSNTGKIGHTRRDISEFLISDIVEDTQRLLRSNGSCRTCSIGTRTEYIITPDELGYDETEEVKNVLVYEIICHSISPKTNFDLSGIRNKNGYTSICSCALNDRSIDVTCTNCRHSKELIIRRNRQQCSTMRRVYVCVDGPMADRCRDGLALSSYVHCDGAERIQ